MSSLVKVFIDIVLWRRGPQDLPASYSLACWVALIYAATSFIHVLLYGWQLRVACMLVAIDVAMLCVWVWLLLFFFAKRPRFLQTITAVWGVGAFLTILDIVFAGTQLLLSGHPELPSLWILLRFAAVVLILARILRLATEVGAVTGVALTMAMVFSIERVVSLAIR